MSANGTNAVDAVKDTIYRTCLFLDDQKWKDWLDLCDEGFEYSIKAFSPEIRRDMMYFSGGRKDLASMTEMLPKHNTDHSPLKRHVTVYAVDVDEKNKTATAVTSVVVYQTMLDGINSHIDAGESRLFLIGKYLDKFKLDGGKAKFVAREVRIENRRLDKGSHWPI
jgi:methanesulfonate monooxygenase small subunit